MDSERRNLEVVGLLRERWNAGDYDGVLALMTDDVRLVPTADWPDPPPPPGRAHLREFVGDFLAPWERIEMRFDSVERVGERVVAIGGWDSTGGTSGVGGEIPFGLVCELRDGMIARLDFFIDPPDALNVAVVRSLGDLWNAGDHEALMEHYSDDIEVITDPGWPDAPTSGKDAFARNSEEFRGAWESVRIAIGNSHAVSGGRVLAGGSWEGVGAASGIGGSLPFWILFELRDGLIVRMQWFMQEAEARAAAGL